MNRYKDTANIPHYRITEKDIDTHLEKLGKHRRRKRPAKHSHNKLYGILLVITAALLWYIYGFVSTGRIDGIQSEVYDESATAYSSVEQGMDRTDDFNAMEDTGDADWRLRLVNFSHPLTANPSVQFKQLKNKQAVDIRIYEDLQAMMDAARAEELSPLICSSYRSMDKQTSLYNAKVESLKRQGYSDSEAAAKAAVWVAPPGTSEHQLGLAVDIVAESYQLLDERQEDTPEQKWLIEHCAEYGFILRYPTDKSSITGIEYEPWHYRYVGQAAAREIMSRGICLEEYVEE